jgi:hypothetical protein
VAGAAAGRQPTELNVLSIWDEQEEELNEEYRLRHRRKPDD